LHKVPEKFIFEDGIARGRKKSVTLKKVFGRVEK
jgi:hypothetical protein